MGIAQTSGPVIIVDGIIGAGKSTLVQGLSKRLNLRPIYEPVNDNPYLEDFYRDPKRYAFDMQIHLLQRRYVMQRLAADEAAYRVDYDGAIIDRGLTGDYVFAKLHMLAGNITENQWRTYVELYDKMCLDVRSPTLLVFLDVSPETALRRSNVRARNAEKSMDIQYLRDLYAAYHELIFNLKSGKHWWGINTLDIWVRPWNEDNNPTDVDFLISDIAGKFNISKTTPPTPLEDYYAAE